MGGVGLCSAGLGGRFLENGTDEIVAEKTISASNDIDCLHKNTSLLTVIIAQKSGDLGTKIRLAGVAKRILRVIRAGFSIFSSGINAQA